MHYYALFPYLDGRRSMSCARKYIALYWHTLYHNSR